MYYFKVATVPFISFIIRSSFIETYEPAVLISLLYMSDLKFTVLEVPCEFYSPAKMLR